MIVQAAEAQSLGYISQTRTLANSNATRLLPGLFQVHSVKTEILKINAFLQLATTQLQLSAGAQWKKFTLYSLFGWLLPLTFAVVVVVVDRLKDAVPAEYRPGNEPSIAVFSFFPEWDPSIFRIRHSQTVFHCLFYSKWKNMFVTQVFLTLSSQLFIELSLNSFSHVV